MSNFICSYVEYCAARNCENNQNGEAVAKSGYSFTQLDSANVIQFSQQQKGSDGNPLFEQELTINTLNDCSGFVHELFILNLYLMNGTKKQWGTLTPFNPVQAFLNLDNLETSVTFTRQDVAPV